MQNLLIRDPSQGGRGKTLSLMPRGKPGSKKTISDAEMSTDVGMRAERKLVAVKEVEE